MQRGHGEDVVERVRQAIDIVELIGAYVDLRPAGRDFKACCPFHREKTPSFHVSAERQLFHCFGCGVGGDVFSFLMKHDGLTFPEALETLARRASIELPERHGPKGPDRARLISAMRAAVRYYRGKLRAEPGAGARRYLENRGIPQRLLDLYYVGLAPGGGQALLDLARRRFSVEALVQAGLVGQSREGRLYDRFRDRIVIPILSVAGDPIGFGARALDANVEPKYLNSPETPIYKKGRVLFGLPQARQAIRVAGSALVVEGYFDVLGLAAGGIHHAVAPCGTAWTREHMHLLLRYTPRPLFLFDGDAAGEMAAWRALENSLPIHPDVGIVVLPSGKDPDDMVRDGRIAELRDLIEAPLSPVAFGHECLARQGLEGHNRVARLAELIGLVESGVAREMMVDEAAERVRMPARLVREEVERTRGGRRKRAAGRADPGQPETPVTRLTPLEEAVMQLTEREPSAAGKLYEASRGAPAVREKIREVLLWVEERVRSGAVPEAPELLRKLRGELGEEVEVAFLLDREGRPADEQFRENLLRRLEEQAIESELETLGYEIRALEAKEEPGARLKELLEQKQALARRLAHLREPRRGVQA